MREKKPQARRKLPKKSKRQKRRYILFSLKGGSCKNAKQAFDLVMGQFPVSERKALGVWFIEFSPEKGLGIVRCKLGSVEQVKQAIAAIKAVAGVSVRARTLRTSGTLRKLRPK